MQKNNCQNTEKEKYRNVENLDLIYAQGGGGGVSMGRVNTFGTDTTCIGGWLLISMFFLKMKST